MNVLRCKLPHLHRKRGTMEEHLKQISDGKLYHANDMVKVGCHDCEGCSLCCHDMGESILLDPFDIDTLTKNLNQTFEQLLDGPVELHVEDGLILPNLKMQGKDEPVCSFLNEQGRCGIHSFRPGICRLFPLGRNYEGDKLSYFLLKDACPAKNKSKLKISKWLETDRLREYERFLVEWHRLVKRLREEIAGYTEETIRQMNLKFLHLFFMQPYESEDFFEQFYIRLEEAGRFLPGV